ncbi:MAG: DUF4400 domain-containing protein [Dechloromonas sp.]|nr:DUF4400 domain-containing protein [Dechloromonas sp.]
MTRHTLIWLLIMIAVLIFSPLLTGAIIFERETLRDLQAAERWYGADEANALVERANAIYDVLMIKSRIDKLVTYYSKPANLELSPGVQVPAHLRDQSIQVLDYWRNLGANIWLFSLRLSHTWLWLFYLSPFMAAIIFDGIMTRKAKLVSFKYTSPALFNMSWHMIIGVTSVAFVLMAVCIPISIFFYPFAIATMGVLLRLMISNIQHSA